MMRIFLVIILFILTFGTFSEAVAQEPPGDTRYVWTDAEGYGRFKVSYFRYEMILEDIPEIAELHLFADSRYHLLVNGHFVHFGPARFYPTHPEYDTYDLRPWLREGENVLAVKVVSNGTHTFQLRRNPPALIAWGQVGEHDLSTPGDWRCHRIRGYDEHAPKMTFATGPMEIYDARKDVDIFGWEQPGFDASGWKHPVAITHQDTWGPLQPRSIPHLTGEVFRPRQLLGVYPLKGEEDIFSFRVKTPDTTRNEFRKSRPLFGYTYIFSPREQEVEVGIWWGDHYLNGEGPLPQREAGPGRPHRQKMTLRLNEGWNYFFVKRRSFWGKWDFYLALPREAGLMLSPYRERGDSLIFRTAGPFLPAEEEEVEALEVPFYEGELPATLSASWQDHVRRAYTPNPAIEMAWRCFGEPYDVPAWQVDEVEVDDPNGTALVYDFRYKKLGRIVVEYEAPEGTVIDAGFTEDLLGPQANVMKRNGLYMATRHIAAGGAGRLETLKPYGLRYLQLNVRHNNEPVRIKQVRVVHQVYPFRKMGAFECSDPLMNAIWELGWRTLRVCAEDSYTDTPFRERGLYAGDMLPQMGVTLAGSSDLRLVKRSLRLFQDMYADLFFPGVERYPSEIGLLEDYPLLTLEALSWYTDYTGDLDFAAGLFPAYDHLISNIMRNRSEQGLFHTGRVFIEWTQIEKQDVKNTAYHAILARSCHLMSRLARKMERYDDADRYFYYYQYLDRTIRARLWNPEKGLFYDGWKEDRPIDHYYPISSAWPYLAGLTRPWQDSTIFPYISEVLKDIGSVNRQRMTTPYGGFYLLGALYDYGLPAVAERFIRQYWSPMVYQHEDTAWENFGSEGIGTLSHAWSAAPTYYLTAQVLGVNLGWPNPVNPEQIVIAPQVGDIIWAGGTVPHPKGPIHIYWEDRGDQLWMEVEVPAGVDWTVAPKGRLAEKEWWVNGQRYE